MTYHWAHHKKYGWEVVEVRNIRGDLAISVFGVGEDVPREEFDYLSEPLVPPERIG